MNYHYDSPSEEVQVANETNFRTALQDSHSTLSMSTFTQPFLAQAKELAAWIKIASKDRDKHMICIFYSQIQVSQKAIHGEESVEGKYTIEI